MEKDSIIVEKYPRLCEAMLKEANLQEDGRNRTQIVSDTQDFISQLLDNNSVNNMLDDTERLIEKIETSLIIPEELKRKRRSTVV